MFRNALVDSSNNACGVEKVSGSKKGTAWWNREAHEIEKKKRSKRYD